MTDEDSPIPADSFMGDLFEYRGVVCQLMYRFAWYDAEQDTKLWGVVIYWPDGETLPLARIHDEPEQAVANAQYRIREELGETPCPTTVTTTD